MVNKNLAKELKIVFAEDFGREVSIEEANEILVQITGYFDLLSKINHKILTENNNQRQSNGTYRKNNKRS